MEPLPDDKITYTELRSWPDDIRWELVDGQPFAMSGASVAHQAICRNLTLALSQRLIGKPCQLFFAPLDVLLSEFDVAQPDLMLVCQRSQLKKTHVEGPPALVIEIISPSSLRHDRIRKLRLYAKYGVKEYWLFQPSPPMAEVYFLDGQTYRIHGTFSEKDTLVSPSFPELNLDLEEILPPLEEGYEEIRETPPPYLKSRATGFSG